MTREVFWSWESRETMVSCWSRVRICGSGDEEEEVSVDMVEMMSEWEGTSKWLSNRWIRGW